MNLRLQLLAVTVGLDLSRPPALLYVERDGDWRLAGVEYVLAQAPAGPGPIPTEAWERHEASCHYRDDEELAAASPSACPSEASDHRLAVRDLASDAGRGPRVGLHPQPGRPFAPENAALAPWGGSVASPLALGRRGRLLHAQPQVSGAMLLTVARDLVADAPPAAIPVVGALRAGVDGLQRLPVLQRGSRSVAAGAGILSEALADGVVVQHKLLAVIPMLIGIIEVLRGAGWLRSPRWLVAFPALALLGGGALFIHTHDGGFHLDQRFLASRDHGGDGAGRRRRAAGARGTRAGRAVLTVAWPILLTLVSLLLLVYFET